MADTYENSKKFRIKVPATSANIGPGFDVLGMALQLHLKLDVEVGNTSSDNEVEEIKGQRKVMLHYHGAGANDAPLDPYKNLITRVALYVLRCHGRPYFPKRVKIDVYNEIPFGRGLGSSGAAVIAGVLLGDGLGQLGLSVQRQLDFALMIERHPDNVTPALVGGFAGAYKRQLSEQEDTTYNVPLAEVLPEYPEDASEEWGKEPPVPPQKIGLFKQFEMAPEIKAVAVIPEFELSTAKARDVLPAEYKREDCLFNMQRAVVLCRALSDSPPDAQEIYMAMQDRLHQPYRKQLVPALAEILESLNPTDDRGLLGVCLSGAGPTILALATERFTEIGSKIQGLWEKEGVRSSARILEVDTDGASIEYIR